MEQAVHTDIPTFKPGGVASSVYLYMYIWYLIDFWAYSMDMVASAVSKIPDQVTRMWGMSRATPLDPNPGHKVCGVGRSTPARLDRDGSRLQES